MNARDAILNAVRAARPTPVALPSVDVARTEFPQRDGDVVRRFLAAARAGGADVVEGERGAVARLVHRVAPEATWVMSAVPSVSSTVSPLADARTLADLELCVCEAVIGVAENGAMWLPLSRLGSRASAFLAEHVVVLLDRSAIVPDLHDAYERIDVAGEAFGFFVAGPSKTADIEQSLVIGAHGPKRLTVIVV